MRVDQDSAKPTNGWHKPDHRFTGDGSAPETTDDVEQAGRTIPDELKLLLKQFGELGDGFSYFLTAKTDSVKLALRHVVLCVVLAALSFVVFGGLIVIACWLILSGMAEVLAELFGNRSWAGRLITGFLVLGGLGAGTYYAGAKRNRIARGRAAEKYERLKSQTK